MFDEKLMTIANTLVAGCREGKAAENLGKLYAADAVSIEPADMGGGGVVTNGVDAIRGKHEWWEGAFEVHDAKVEGPFLHGDDRFAVIFEIDATNKESNERSQMREVAVYTLKDGKIVREEFYFGM